MSQGEVKYARVIPKDKIYRNIFEAECNVNESLKKERTLFKPKREPTLPVLKQPVSFTTGNGILSERQRTWVEANPNEPYVENPTYQRCLLLDEQEKTSKTESYLDAQVVRGLPAETNVGTNNSKSKVIEKIHGSRKERHQVALEELHQELGIISSDLEPYISEASETLRAGFAENDEELSKILQLFSNDQDLLKFSLKELHGIWGDIAETSTRRQEFIVDLEESFTKIEQHRYKRVCETLRSYNATFEGIAYFMASDVHRMMEREAEEINATVLCNRRTYADLIATLQKAAVEQERKHYHTWQSYVKTWKHLKTHNIVNEFIEYMDSEDIRKPCEVQRQLECMRKDQNRLNTKRLELLNTLREMIPPGSTKAAVYQWNNALGHVTDQLDKVNKKDKEIIQKEYDNVIKKCHEIMEQTKSKLEGEHVVDGEELNAIVNESLLPLIGEKKTRYEYEMDMFEKTIDNTANFQDGILRSLFKFVQGAAHIWDTHEIGLARQERALQEELEDKRHRHDGSNQVKEANLDIIMDRMRQDSNQQALDQSLEQAFALLEEIQDGYKVFHTAQLECVHKYPQSITEELECYDKEVCCYFTVERNKPSKKNQQRGGKLTGSSSRQTRGPRETSTYAATLEEVLKTSNGTNFYVITYSAGEFVHRDTLDSARSMKTSMTFLSDEPDEENTNLMYVENVVIEEELLSELRKHLRMQFLESLEKWKIEAMERANSVVAAKVEELNSELDLRLHLHQPRCARATQDVHNVRAAELIMHQDRVDRHSKGTQITLSEFKGRFQTMIEEHNEETEKFKKAVQAFETTFISATKTHELLAIQDQVSGQVEEYMRKIRTSLRKFRQDLDGMLSSLRNSNARFRKSFKVFSDGGNFSLNEVEEFRKKLERLANKIDQSEGSIMGELEGMESKRLEAAMEYAGKLEDRFKNHLFDLTFMEKTTRWITNTQVKIKSEVAKSNAQAKDLAMNLTKLERRIDAVRNPNLDKEQVSAEDLKNELPSIFESFIDRTIFLDCLLIDSSPCYSVVRGEKQAFEENTYVEQKKEKKPQEKKDTSRKLNKVNKKTSSLEKMQNFTAIGGPVIETTLSSTTDVRPKTMPAENERNPSIKHSAQSLTYKTQRSGTSRRQSAARREFLTRFEKKYLAFGEKSDEEPKHFLAKIINILRNSLEGLLATAEGYYRQKGPRVPTRPSVIHDNFDISATATIQRLISYRAQAEDYHNSCIQELRGQLKKLVSLVVQVPVLVIESFVVQHTSETQIFVNKIKKNYEESIDILEKQKKQHESLLRPSLGHPKNRDELEEVKKQEKDRTGLRMKTLKDFTDELKGYEVERAKIFTENLARICTETLQWFDGIVTVDDVKTGKVESKPKSTKQILVERTKPPKNEQEEDSEPSSKPGRKWEGLPTNELILIPPDTITRTPPVSTTRTTAGHVEIIEARNKAYKEYKSNFFACLNQIKEKGEITSYEEERWQENWTKSLQRIQILY